MESQSGRHLVRPISAIGRRNFLLGLAGMGLASLKFPEARAYQSFTPFSFAHVCDVNLTNQEPDSYMLTQESQLFLQQLVKEINQQHVDFVMFGGDQIHAISKSEDAWALFEDCLAPLNVPWSFVLGERDVSGPTSIDKNKVYSPDWKLLGIKTDTSYWSHNPKVVPDVHIIGLDSSLPNTTLGGISNQQLAWLKQDLEDHKKYFTMVFCHHPLLPPAPYDGGPPWDDYVIPDAASVREILAAYPQVKMVLTGHVHVNKVQVEKGIFHISTPSLVVYPCAYRIFRIEPDEAIMETHQIDFPALVKRARHLLQNSSLAGRFNQSNPASFVELAAGEKLDYDAMLPLNGSAQLKAMGGKKQPPRPRRQDNEEKPAKLEKAESAPPGDEHKKKGFFHRDKAAAEQPKASSSKTSVEDIPESKPVELPQIKDVDAELNKQLNLTPSTSKDTK